MAKTLFVGILRKLPKLHGGVAMTPAAVLEVVSSYEAVLSVFPISPARVDTTSPGPFSVKELIAHAKYLLPGIREFATQEGKWGKTNRHLASVQMFLLMAGIFSLEDVMNHNRPKDGGNGVLLSCG